MNDDWGIGVSGAKSTANRAETKEDGGTAGDSGTASGADASCGAEAPGDGWKGREERGAARDCRSGAQNELHIRLIIGELLEA